MRTLPAAILMLVLAACTLPSAEPSAEATAPVELSAHGGEPCPTELPSPEDDPSATGFGTHTPAEAMPALDLAGRAWVCVYNAVDVGVQPDGNGVVSQWERAKAPVGLSQAALRELTGPLAEIRPPSDPRGCTFDLGPRYLVVLETAGDLTGVSLEAYGCRDAAITDNPFVHHPGEGAWPGYLVGAEAALDVLRDIA